MVCVKLLWKPSIRCIYSPYFSSADKIKLEFICHINRSKYLLYTINLSFRAVHRALKSSREPKITLNIIIRTMAGNLSSFFEQTFFLTCNVFLSVVIILPSKIRVTFKTICFIKDLVQELYQHRPSARLKLSWSDDHWYEANIFCAR